MTKWERIIIAGCVLLSLSFLGHIFNPEAAQSSPPATPTVAKASGGHLKRCEDAIEESAKYNFRWTSWSGRLVQVEVQKDPAHQMFSFVGNSAEAQNGLGNWLPVHYSCDITRGMGIVLNVTIAPGRR
jgi:hypothetical protein